MWTQLLIGIVVFCVGLAVALYLHLTLGKWEEDNVKRIYARRAEALAADLQSQIHGFEFELVSLGTQMQLQPNSTRAQFKVAGALVCAFCARRRTSKVRGIRTG
jgi:sensor domain CHASE-containing protein